MRSNPFFQQICATQFDAYWLLNCEFPLLKTWYILWPIEEAKNQGTKL